MRYPAACARAVTAAVRPHRVGAPAGLCLRVQGDAAALGDAAGIWRAGLDLNALDPANPSQVGWLEALVWPEQAQRLTDLRAALRIAATHRPRNVKGDLLGDCLRQLCGKIPKDAIVFHTAVLVDVADRAGRQAFRRTDDVALSLLDIQ